MPKINRNITRTSFSDELQSSVTSAFDDDYDFNESSANRIERDTARLLGGAERTRYEDIPRELIYPNRLNKRYMESVTDKDIDAIKYSILEQKVMFHNLVVVEDGMGKYRLISGEKRWTAVGRMTPEQVLEIFPKGIRCQIIPCSRDLSEIDEHIMLLTCNVLVASVGTRDDRQVRDLIKLYIKKGYENNEIVEYLSKYLDNSKATMYKLINEANAVEELVKLYDGDKITKSALQILGGIEDKEEQKRIAEQIENDGLEVNESIASDFARSVKEAKKTGRAPKKQTSVFIKANKSLKTVEASMARQVKLTLDGIQDTEKENLVLILENIEGYVKEMRQKLGGEKK